MNAPDWLTGRPIAHRGLHDPRESRFENTISAARAAIAGGYAIECDIQVSQDGEAMVFHDHELDRLTGETGPVRDCPAAVLREVAIGGTADRIPTLSDFLDLIGDRTALIVEVKSRFDGDERLARRLAEILASRPGLVAVKSFDPEIVRLLRRLVPDRPRGIVAQSRYEGGEWEKLGPSLRHDMAQLLHFDETRPDFLSWRHQDLAQAAPYLGRLLGGRPVMAWTVRSREEQAAARARADQIVFEGFVPD